MFFSRYFLLVEKFSRATSFFSISSKMLYHLSISASSSAVFSFAFFFVFPDLPGRPRFPAFPFGPGLPFLPAGPKILHAIS